MSRTDDILDGLREPIWKTPVCDEELAKIRENYKKLQAENDEVIKDKYELEDAIPVPFNEICEAKECGGCLSDEDKPCEEYEKFKKQQLAKMDAFCRLANIMPYTKLQAEHERQKTAIQIAQEYIRGESGACNINNAVRILLSMDEILKGE